MFLVLCSSNIRALLFFYKYFFALVVRLCEPNSKLFSLDSLTLQLRISPEYFKPGRWCTLQTRLGSGLKGTLDVSVNMLISVLAETWMLLQSCSADVWAGLILSCRSQPNSKLRVSPKIPKSSSPSCRNKDLTPKPSWRLLKQEHLRSISNSRNSVLAPKMLLFVSCTSRLCFYSTYINTLI